jgi:hypothetical protein
MTQLWAHIATPTRPLLRSRCLWLCLFAFALLWPQLAIAAVGVPMSSPYGETIAAPPPESPPTGGEIRGVRNIDPRAPSLDLAPQSDPGPLPWELPTLEPAVVAPPFLPLIARSITTDQPNGSTTQRGSLGVRTEVFRPPCAR